MEILETKLRKLKKIKKIASRKKIKGQISASTRKNKKYMIVLPDSKKKIHFGAVGYEDYLDHGDKKRRDKFHSRFKTNKGYNDKNSGLYYSSKLLW